jgi:hypothetical protein
VEIGKLPKVIGANPLVLSRFGITSISSDHIPAALRSSHGLMISLTATAQSYPNTNYDALRVAFMLMHFLLPAKTSSDSYATGNENISELRASTKCGVRSRVDRHNGES